MSQILDKGETYRLDADLAKIRVGFGWKPRDPKADLDASCLMLAKNDQVRSDADVIFYNQHASPCGAVQQLEGAPYWAYDEFDYEEFVVDFTKVPNDVAKLLFVVTIYDANGQTFDQIVDDAYLRLVDSTTDEEILRHHFINNGRCESLLFGEFVKENDGWTFRALSQDFPGDLRALLVSYGVNVDD